MIKFSHSVFALPFALASAVFASARYPLPVSGIAWIVVAMVGARSAAMGFNRLVDREIDAANPRTSARELPRRVLSPQAARVFVAASSAVLILAASQLNRLCLYLSPLALATVFFYSYTKRFTWASHLFLGLSLGIAPVGAWIAVTGTLEAAPLLLGLAVLLWVAGFDIVYACQDCEFDRNYGLFSLPQRFGVGVALVVARLLHGVTVALLLALKSVLGLGTPYLAGLGCIACILVYEHALVRSNDLSRLNLAFFNMNGLLSVAYLVFSIGDKLL